ncbi:PREDICTED: uncharacterized protein LOC108772028 [Cyphomyrmex costatus]|uniref:uncharacterized protein LOC108772028 n=1 Tax=Cyphomyrmex costatus TaxID=456900 RepID=UPI0008522D64|nr:PREDICTED: uncharacterized protein LOC108772028 [Cyphomyrmex costatus]
MQSIRGLQQDAEVLLKDSLKYLGVIIDSRFTFEQHFVKVGEKARKTVGKLSGILPNVEGPNSLVRRLHASVIDSITLYAAPVWIDKVEKNKKIQRALNQLQRRIACRIIRGYRTICYVTFTLLAGTVPLIMKARMYAKVYDEIKEVKAGGNTHIDTRVTKRIRIRAKARMFRKWYEWIHTPGNSGGEVGMAIRPTLTIWSEKKVAMSYHLTQILTGHGCFGQYLCHIQKESTKRCWHCPSALNTATHTIVECSAWTRERAELRGVIGNDLSYPALITALLSDKAKKEAVFRFSDQVMSIKEEAERARQGIVLTPDGTNAQPGPSSDVAGDGRQDGVNVSYIDSDSDS